MISGEYWRDLEARGTRKLRGSERDHTLCCSNPNLVGSIGQNPGKGQKHWEGGEGGKEGGWYVGGAGVEVGGGGGIV